LAGAGAILSPCGVGMKKCRDLRGGMHAGSLQPHETVLSRLTGVRPAIEVMITATMPVS